MITCLNSLITESCFRDQTKNMNIKSYNFILIKNIDLTVIILTGRDFSLSRFRLICISYLPDILIYLLDIRFNGVYLFKL